MKPIEKILVPTDLSELSLEALGYALALGKTWGAKIYLIHVIDILPMVSLPAVDYSMESGIGETRTETKRVLEAVARERRLPDVGIEAVVREGVAHKEIVRFVKEEGIDLVVITSHGRTGLPHFLFGSIAEKVVHHSPVPVLAVKRPQGGHAAPLGEHPENLIHRESVV